jgi:hypothetical protein
MNILKYLAVAKVIIDNKDLIIGITSIAANIAYVGGCYVIEYINYCKCGVCENRRKNGKNPIH